MRIPHPRSRPTSAVCFWCRGLVARSSPPWSCPNRASPSTSPCLPKHARWHRQTAPQPPPRPGSSSARPPRADSPGIRSRILLFGKVIDVGGLGEPRPPTVHSVLSFRAQREICFLLESCRTTARYDGSGSRKLPFTSSLSTIASAISFIALRFCRL